MIRLLDNQDNDMLIEFINKEKDLNTFIIGNIENYGYDKDFQKVWGEFNQESELVSVLLKHFNNFLFYSTSDYDAKGFLDILKSEGFSKVSGEKSIMKKFENAYSFSSSLDNYLCRLDNSLNLKNDNSADMVLRAELRDVDSIVQLYNSVEEFRIYGNKPDNIIRRIQDGTGRTYYIKDGSTFIAAAQSSAESSEAAMIVGVCTHDDYRKKGYSSICLSKLCSDLLSEGKVLYLLYDNPVAGLLYKKLGFESIGMWTSFFR
jgi:uncharacterized protein